MIGVVNTEPIIRKVVVRHEGIDKEKEVMGFNLADESNGGSDISISFWINEDCEIPNIAKCDII